MDGITKGINDWLLTRPLISENKDSIERELCSYARKVSK